MAVPKVEVNIILQSYLLLPSQSIKNAASSLAAFFVSLLINPKQNP